MPTGGPAYRVPYRRRREGKTDYRARKTLVLSRKPRVVIRGSLRNILVQMLVAKPGGDEVLLSAHSRELLKNYGWKAHRGNIPTAYLTGFLCGLKARTKDIKHVVPDIGLQTPSKGARAFAAVRGILDAGVDVPHSDEKLPTEERLKGGHIVQYMKMLAANPEEYQSRFSKYFEQETSPDKLGIEIEEVKKRVAAAFEKGAKA